MTHQNKQSKNIFVRGVFWIAIISIIVIVGFSYATINGRVGETSTDQPTYEVKKGPLTVSVIVSGTIQAQEKEIIKSELEGSNAILYIVPEGTQVKQGEVLVELDASTLQDQLVEQQIKVLNAEASYINARENLAIVENQAQSDIDAAELKYMFAKQDLRQYVEGEFPKMEKEYQSQIALNEEDLNQKQNDLKWSQILFEEKYLSQSELQKAQIAEQRSKLNLDTAEADLDLLNDFTFHRQIAQLTSDVTQAEMELERTKRKANANIVSASAELESRKAEWDQQVSKLNKIKDQISKAVIKAPMDGVVVYASSVRQSFRGNQEPLEEGQTVREREDLIHLPTTSAYMVDARVHESSLEKIRLGLPVRITIDAVPGKVFNGRVSSIAPLPDAQSMFMNPDLKVYKTLINVEGNGNDLRSGMSCQAEIIIDQFKETTYIPVTAVLRVNGKPTVYVAKGNEIEQRQVELGPDNNSLAQIESGLEEGEKVLLNPPLAAASVAEKEYEDYDIPEKTEETETANQANSPQSVPGAMNPSAQRGEGQRGPGMRGSRGGQGGQRGPRGEGGRPDFQNMSPEEREAMRQRFQQNRQRGGNPE